MAEVLYRDKLEVNRKYRSDAESAAGMNASVMSHAFLLSGCLLLPFDTMTLTARNCFVASAIGKIYKLRTERLRELEAPWLRK